ncbi:MAG: LacI family DNA-binding transcriptional regulator [Candidatus Omnitrophota bacterium]
MNITDVAKLSGVSITTVSRVINQGKVSIEVKARVIAVIQKYHYQPDPHAQYLGRKRNGKT